MKKEIKKIIKKIKAKEEKKEELPVEVGFFPHTSPQKTESEVERDMLIFLRDEMVKRGINDLGTLGVKLAILEREIQAVKGKNPA